MSQFIEVFLPLLSPSGGLTLGRSEGWCPLLPTAVSLFLSLYTGGSPGRNVLRVIRVTETLASKLPLPRNKYTTNTPKFQSYHKDNGIFPNRFRLATVSPDFTLSELIKQKSPQSTGPDKLPARFLRDEAKVIAKPLTRIINSSIMTDTVSRELKGTQVTPIYKKEEKLNVTNYRLVSILYIVFKILEKAI